MTTMPNSSAGNESLLLRLFGVFLIIVLIYSAYLVSGWGLDTGNLRFVHLGGALASIVAGIATSVVVFNGARAADKSGTGQQYTARQKLIAEIFACFTLLTLIGAMFSHGLHFDQNRRGVFAEQARGEFKSVRDAKFCQSSVTKKVLCDELLNNLNDFVARIEKKVPELEIEHARISARNSSVKLTAEGHQHLAKITRLLTDTKINPMLGELTAMIPILVFAFACQSVARKISVAAHDEFRISGSSSLWGRLNNAVLSLSSLPERLAQWTRPPCYVDNKQSIAPHGEPVNHAEISPAEKK